VGVVPTLAAANPFNLGPAAVFSHYASHAFRPEQRVAASTQTLDDTPYTEVSRVLPPALLQQLLTAAGDGASLVDLVSSAQVPADHAWYALTWLIKYGLLRLE
jgi:hypothetical protein